MARRWTLVSLVVGALVAGGGCEESAGFATLAGSLEVSPEEVELNPVWAGIGATAELRLRNRGSAPLDGVAVEVRDPTGEGSWTATLIASALGPGDEAVALVMLEADEGVVGTATATIAITSSLDGEVVVPARASILPAPSCDDFNPCTTDRFDREAGLCTHEVLPDATACDDGSACTTGDLCLMGRCTGAAVTCDDGVGCTVDSCDGANGCVFTPVAERCGDEDPCTDDVCRPDVGCENPPLEEGALCHFDGCTEIGLCFGGSCEIRPTPNGVPCEDGDACTVADVCIDGECQAGGELGVGPTQPVPVHPWLAWADLCAGPEEGGWDCYADTTQVQVDEVLAVERFGAEARLVWRGPFVGEYGAPCDPLAYEHPSSQMLPNTSADAPPEDGEAGAAEPPSSPICAAPVFLSGVPIAGGAGWTQQLTAARGPVAAAIRVSGGTALLDVEGPEIAIAAATSRGRRVVMELFDRDGLPMFEARASGEPLFVTSGDLIAEVSVAIADTFAIAAAHGQVRTGGDTGLDCAFPGCAPRIAISAHRFPFGVDTPVVDRDLFVGLDVDPTCAASVPGPLDARDLTAAISGDTAIIHLRAAVDDPCSGLEDEAGPEAPTFLPVEPDPTQRAWRIETPADLGSDLPTFGPHPVADVPASRAATHRLAAEDDLAVLVWDEELPCGDCDCPDVDNEPCDCFTTCRAFRIDTLTGLTGSERWLDGFGNGASLAAAPLWLDDEPALAVLNGGAVELLRRAPDGSMEQQSGVLPTNAAWRAEAGLVPGARDSGLVAGLASSTDPEQLAPGERPNHALVQSFSCIATGTEQVPCIDDDACAAGEYCNTESVCLADPHCAADEPCDAVCYGACTPLSPADAGAPDDAGAVGDAGAEPDAGAELDAGVEADAGLPESDAGEALEDSGVADGGPDAGTTEADAGGT